MKQAGTGAVYCSWYALRGLVDEDSDLVVPRASRPQECRQSCGLETGGSGNRSQVSDAGLAPEGPSKLVTGGGIYPGWPWCYQASPDMLVKLWVRKCSAQRIRHSS